MRLIDADALCRYANNLKDKQIDANDIMRFPRVDAEPVRHGRWIEHHEPFTWMGYTTWTCSECNYECGYEKEIGLRTSYCPHCGAKMDEEEKDCERCLQVTERPGNDICKACGGRRGQDATRMEENDLRDLRE